MSGKSTEDNVIAAGNSNIIESGFFDQALCLKQYVDFYYLDVMSSQKECQIALSVTEKIKKPALVGLHIKANGRLPSGEKVHEVINACKKYKIVVEPLKKNTAPAILSSTLINDINYNEPLRCRKKEQTRNY